MVTDYCYMVRYCVCYAYSRGGQDESARWIDKIFLFYTYMQLDQLEFIMRLQVKLGLYEDFLDFRRMGSTFKCFTYKKGYKL